MCCNNSQLFPLTKNIDNSASQRLVNRVASRAFGFDLFAYPKKNNCFIRYEFQKMEFEFHNIID
jgi:hypothetical protein